MRQGGRFKLVSTNNTFLKMDSVYKHALAVAAYLLLLLDQFFGIYLG